MKQRAEGKEQDFIDKGGKFQVYTPPKAIRLENFTQGKGACNPGSAEVGGACHDGGQAPGASCHTGGYAGNCHTGNSAGSCNIGSSAGNCSVGSVPQ